MNLEGIISTGKNEYVITKLSKIEIVSAFAYPGDKVYCTETEKMYVCIGLNEWVSI